MERIFNPIKQLFQDLGTNLLEISMYIAIVGIIVCAIGATTGSERNKEKFKTGFVTIMIAFTVITLARVIVSAVKSYF